MLAEEYEAAQGSVSWSSPCPCLLFPCKCSTIRPSLCPSLFPPLDMLPNDTSSDNGRSRSKPNLTPWLPKSRADTLRAGAANKEGGDMGIVVGEETVMGIVAREGVGGEGGEGGPVKGEGERDMSLVVLHMESREAWWWCAWWCSTPVRGAGTGSPGVW